MNRLGLRTLIALVALAITPLAQSAIVTSTHTSVTEFFALSEYGGGDVGFIAADPAQACPHGYWLRPTDAGFKSLYAALMLAYAMKSPVRVAAYDDSIWSGSTGTYCRVYYINPQ